MKTKKSVSAIIPVYNSEGYIEETINSLLNQKKKFDEIIIVDDGSTDNTLNILKKIKGIKIIKTVHAERSAARNKGWKSAKSDIIAIMESDSIFDKNWLYEVAKCFGEGCVAAIDKRKMYKPKTFIAKMNDHFFELRYKNYKPFNAWVMTKNVLEETGGFDESLKGPEDKDLGDRIISKGYNICFAKKAIQYHKGEPKSMKESLRRNFFYGSRIIPYWKKTKNIPYLKFTFFTVMCFGIIKPIIFVSMGVIYLFYALLRDALRGMKVKYLWFHPFYLLVGELCSTIGSWYSILGGSMKKIR